MARIDELRAKRERLLKQSSDLTDEITAVHLALYNAEVLEVQRLERAADEAKRREEIRVAAADNLGWGEAYPVLYIKGLVFSGVRRFTADAHADPNGYPYIRRPTPRELRQTLNAAADAAREMNPLIFRDGWDGRCLIDGSMPVTAAVVRVIIERLVGNLPHGILDPLEWEKV
jgi:hypothetical protein